MNSERIRIIKLHKRWADGWTLRWMIFAFLLFGGNLYRFGAIWRWRSRTNGCLRSIECDGFGRSHLAVGRRGRCTGSYVAQWNRSGTVAT
jgi:hypothetical protein